MRQIEPVLRPLRQNRGVEVQCVGASALPMPP